MKKRFEWTKYLSKGERWFLWGSVAFQLLCLLVSIIVIFYSPFTGIATTLLFTLLLYTGFDAPKRVAMLKKHLQEMKGIDDEIKSEMDQIEEIFKLDRDCKKSAHLN